jgi:hypothetical protein
MTVNRKGLLTAELEIKEAITPGEVEQPPPPSGQPILCGGGRYLSVCLVILTERRRIVYRRWSDVWRRIASYSARHSAGIAFRRSRQRSYSPLPSTVDINDSLKLAVTVSYNPLSPHGTSPLKSWRGRMSAKRSLKKQQIVKGQTRPEARRVLRDRGAEVVP